MTTQLNSINFLVLATLTTATSLFAPSGLNAAELVVPEITVLGESEKSSPLDFVPTVSELSGSRLQRKQQSTLGETLSRETGVNASQFGPNASRPVIRGLDGERIRILQNGTGVLDASAASQDHAVASDPLTNERIEIVRGPSALLYGSSAVGGVVNVVTKRIPETSIEAVQGKLQSRYSSNDDGRSVGALIEGPITTDKKWVFHIDGSARAADDYKVPGYARTEYKRQTDPKPNEDRGVVTNSFNRTWNGAIGTSHVTEETFAGVSFANYSSKYGTVAEKAVNLDMLQQRFDFSGGIKNFGWFDSAKLKATVSNYRHSEIEEGRVGTTFKNTGNESRLELKHRRIGPLEGFVGAQQNFFVFEALGDEAFLPRTNNSSVAAFIFEEADFGRFKPSAGARLDSATVSSDVTQDKVATFGTNDSKSFLAASTSVGLSFKLTGIDTAVLNGSYTERAPNYQELFANGQHVATAAFEVGDKNLGKEFSQALEISLRRKTDEASGLISLFAQDFRNFIALSPSGATDAGSGLPIYNYQAVPARMIGAEIEYRHALPSAIPGGVLELEIKSDFVRGFNRSTGTSLPRIPALRESLGLNYKADRYQADIEVQRTERQSELAPNERETAAYNLVNFGAEVPAHLAGTLVSISARVLNVFDVEARNHVSILKESAPLPGRSINLGIQAQF